MYFKGHESRGVGVEYNAKKTRREIGGQIVLRTLAATHPRRELSAPYKGL